LSDGFDVDVKHNISRVVEAGDDHWWIITHLGFSIAKGPSMGVLDKEYLGVD
jgi:hypothetical protein